jgi:hypothetical protein
MPNQEAGSPDAEDSRWLITWKLGFPAVYLLIKRHQLPFPRLVRPDKKREAFLSSDNSG